MDRNGWTPLSTVGCYWTKGPYTVSTIRQGDKSGYILVKDRQVLGEFLTWEEVEKLTNDESKGS